jgi:hypothetical protein
MVRSRFDRAELACQPYRVEEMSLSAFFHVDASISQATRPLSRRFDPKLSVRIPNDRKPASPARSQPPRSLVIERKIICGMIAPATSARITANTGRLTPAAGTYSARGGALSTFGAALRDPATCGLLLERLL